MSSETSEPRRPSSLVGLIDALLDRSFAPRTAGKEIGRSRGGRAVRAFRCGRGPIAISLIGGCHADEPVGPRLLRRLAGHLSALDDDHPLLERYTWSVIPHVNPDGEEVNRVWLDEDDERVDPIRYLRSVVREAPGDDIEFGFPRDADDVEARPETRAAARWWRMLARPFHLHASLHGMAIGAGPWFLVEPRWVDRLDVLFERCAAAVAALGYELHDVERRGEKGFERIGRGFGTRPDSEAMARYFRERDDTATAALFRPSSMETIRSLGGDPLTLVSEMPLFITPGVGREIGPPDPLAEAWRARLLSWRTALAHATDDTDTARLRAEITASGLRPMAIRDQMRLQWTFITEGIRAVERVTTRERE